MLHIDAKTLQEIVNELKDKEQLRPRKQSEK